MAGVLFADILLHRTSKEAFATLARDNTVVIAGSAIAADHAWRVAANVLSCFEIEKLKPCNCRRNMQRITRWCLRCHALSLALENCTENCVSMFSSTQRTLTTHLVLVSIVAM